MGNTAKYIIVDGLAIVFCDALTHKDVARFTGKPVESAGFVYFDIGHDGYGDDVVVAKAYGESVSLEIKSREETPEQSPFKSRYTVMSIQEYVFKVKYKTAKTAMELIPRQVIAQDGRRSALKW